MSPELPLQIFIPTEYTQEHHDALITYLTDSRSLNNAVWRKLYQGIDLLDNGLIIMANTTQTFKKVYDDLIGQPFANEYIDQLLTTTDVLVESPQLTANFARQIKPVLEQAGVLKREVPQSILFQGYCLYWWQSFSRGYAFEVFIMRDLEASGIKFEMHDIRSQMDRYSPADLIVQNLLGDIKTSIYFLQRDWQGELRNDFYITRFYEKGQEYTLVVFQKPDAWKAIEGGDTIPGTLAEILDSLPIPIEIKQHGIILIVVDYKSWKHLVHQKQTSEGS